MPFKHHITRRHRVPKARYRVQNWPAYKVVTSDDDLLVLHPGRGVRILRLAEYLAL